MIIILLINKFDNPDEKNSLEFHSYALNNMFFLSCAHNYGFNDFNKISLLTINCISTVALVKDF